MVALLGELVAKGEPIFLDESLESLQSPVVRVKENLGQRDNLQKVHVKMALEMMNICTRNPILNAVYM